MLLMHTADCTYLPRRISFIQQPNIDQIYYILGNTALTLLTLHIGISYNAFESCIHEVIWPHYISGQTSLFVNHMTFQYKYISSSLCYMHIHPTLVSLTSTHMLSMHATYHTSLSPVTIRLSINARRKSQCDVMDTVIFSIIYA